jgi:1-acyl-sn-glycerol-3-phosphate acyltransferase
VGLGWIVGAKVLIEGRENILPGPALYAGKHQAMLDVLVPGLFLPDPAFVYKIELQKELMLGWYLQWGRMIPIARDGQAAALKGLLRAARAARDENRSVVIFPEGTRKWIGSAPDYKPGVMAIYRDLGLPCVPIALNTGLVWKPKGIMRDPGVVTFKILPAIPPGLSRDDFMRELETRIETESEALLPPQMRRSAGVHEPA